MHVSYVTCSVYKVLDQAVETRRPSAAGPLSHRGQTTARTAAPGRRRLLSGAASKRGRTLRNAQCCENSFSFAAPFPSPVES